MPKQVFEHFLVIDFEATCEEHFKIQPIQEIIEVPVVQIESITMKELSRFHQYVKPTERPFLTSFCTSLTGIVQQTVDESKTLPEVMGDLHQWLVSRNLVDLNTGSKTCQWIFVTSGDWDLGLQLPQEAKFRQLTLSEYFGEWINLKKAFAEALGYFPNSLSVMLQDLKIQHQGRLHSGIDDVRNMCEVLRALACSGHVLNTTFSPVSTNVNVHLQNFVPSERQRKRPDKNKNPKR